MSAGRSFYQRRQDLQTVTLVNETGTPLTVSSNRVRVAEPYTLFDGRLQFGINSRAWYQLTASGGSITYTSNLASAALTVTGANGSRAMLQSHEHFRYQAGHPFCIEVTGFLNEAVPTGQVRRMGAFDANNGVFVEFTSTDVALVTRNNGADSRVVSTSWNRATDPYMWPASNIASWDKTKGFIIGICGKWLGYGPIELRINDSVVHVQTNAGVTAGPYMRTATLPICFEVVNTSASSAGTLYATCSKYALEGGMDPPEVTYSHSNSVDLAIPTTQTGLIGIRTATTINSLANRAIIIPRIIGAYSENSRALVKVLLNPTLGGGPVWTPVSATESGVEITTGPLTISAEGTVLTQFFVPAADGVLVTDLTQLFGREHMKLRLNGDGSTRDTLVISATNLAAAGNTDMRGTITWGEWQ